ncbi:MAG TPA: YbaK/EbsC family protein [Gammaproteobacteria bacterium]|jgi:prolyl-tRNA editing enzyme YbaK/EbsC (Cys-tRNA(Pro) deacylase)|nr:YbaK/EbsC family protein [Gammaproteobacteria bacterium]
MTNDDKTLSKSAKVVQEALLKKGMAFEVIELSASTHAAKDAALALGCTVAQIVKSLLFRSEKTNQPILILASGINRINEIIIENIIGEKIVKADADFTRNITGFAIGGVPPVGHVQTIKYIFIDKDLLKFDTLWAAAGTPNAVFSLNSSDLLNLTNGKMIAIK